MISQCPLSIRFKWQLLQYQLTNFNQTAQECSLGDLYKNSKKKFDPSKNMAARRGGLSW